MAFEVGLKRWWEGFEFLTVITEEHSRKELNDQGMVVRKHGVYTEK